MNHKTCRLLLIISIVMPLVGCGGPPRGMVSGKVTLDGKPLSSGQVAFTGQDGIAVIGEIMGDGTYQAQGVLCGEAIVTVVCPNPQYLQHLEQVNAGRKKYGEQRAKGDNSPPPSQPAPPPSNFLPARYSDPHASPLRFQVEGEKNNFDLVLTK